MSEGAEVSPRGASLEHKGTPHPEKLNGTANLLSWKYLDTMSNLDSSWPILFEGVTVTSSFQMWLDERDEGLGFAVRFIMLLLQ
jgi:hypothetical protein